jgi:hypothetical protein
MAAPACDHDSCPGKKADGEGRPGGGSASARGGSGGGGDGGSEDVGCVGSDGGETDASGAVDSDGTSVAGRSITVGGRRRRVFGGSEGGFSSAMRSF